MSVYQLAALVMVLLVSLPTAGWAASLRVSPVGIELSASQAATTVTLRNDDDMAMKFQVRVLRWSQADGEDRLEATAEIVASPPIGPLEPHSERLVRIVRVGPPPTGEQSYRLIVDELPPPPGSGERQVRLLMRHSIPVFIGKAATPQKVRWTAALDQDSVELGGANDGGRHVRISNVRLLDASGAELAARPGLMGYVLPGAAVKWRLPLAPSPGRGQPARLTADTDSGPIDVALPPLLSAAALVALVSAASPALAAECNSGCAQALPLQLEVYRNGEATGLIAAFQKDADGRMSTTASELQAVGLVPPNATGRVVIEDLPGVSYRYDEDQQRIFLQANPSAITALKISLRGPVGPSTPSKDFGAVVNYSLSAQAGLRGRLTADQAAGAFQTRVFGGFGLVESGFVAQAGGRGPAFTRLDTAWVWSRPGSALTGRVGDFISGGFAWSRPIRMGGLQFRRDFATRPDIVTMPTPTLSGSASAPSTLDVMLGSSVVLSRRISAGPVQISDLPVVQGPGQARLVIRDASGIEQQVVASYFATPELLRRGLLDFSGELGFPRRSYGYISDDYAGALAASGSVRYGWTDAATLQAHAELGAGLANAGAGLAATVGDVGALSLAAGASTYQGLEGGLVAAAFETRMRLLTLSAQAQQTFGDYRDLAAVTARQTWNPAGQPLGLTPRSLMQLAVSAPLPFALFTQWGGDAPALSFSYARTRQPGASAQSIITGSVRYAVTRTVAIQASAFRAASDRAESGAYASLNMMLGGDRSASAGMALNGDGQVSGYAEARRQERVVLGSTAWRIRADAGAGDRIEGEAVYRSRVGRLGLRAAYAAGAGMAEARLDGALVALGAPILAPDRIDNAFAVVDVGAPGIEVRQQNRPVGTSDRHGRLLVSNLNPYEANAISIDVDGVSLDLATPRTDQVVSPPYGAGTLVRFGVGKAPVQVSLSLHRPGGEAVPPGALARLNGGPTEIVVGYDGLAFVDGGAVENRLTVDLGDGASCTATFTLDPSNKGPIHVADAICS